MNHMNKYFNNYAVPDYLKRTITAICTRFAISGECDPMYIANTIAHINGFGDGCGHFESIGAIDPIKTAERIQWAYEYNIMTSEKAELADIINTGTIRNKARAISGLKAFRQRVTLEMRTRDPWRVDYLKHLIDVIDRNAQTITSPDSPNA